MDPNIIPKFSCWQGSSAPKPHHCEGVTVLASGLQSVNYSCLLEPGCVVFTQMLSLINRFSTQSEDCSNVEKMHKLQCQKVGTHGFLGGKLN